MKSFSEYGGFHFDASIFFYVVLPPIIFHQGYSLKKRKFFKYFSLIVSFGVLGTLVQFLVITTIAYELTNRDWFPLPFGLNLHESMLVGALFSSADEVATLSVIKQDKYPKLSAVLFGEGVLNDAVSILLFRTVLGGTTTNSIGTEERLSVTHGILEVLKLLGESIYLLVLSGIVGLLSGLCVAACFKYMPSFKRHPEKQTAILMLGGYFSFSMSEVFELSGILSVFFCGVALSHYAWHHLSDAAKITSKLTSESIALIAEAYCFAAIGLSVPEFELAKWSFSFIGLMLLSLMAARAASTYGVIAIGNVFNVSGFDVPIAEQHVIYFGGLVRASISWGLVVQIAQECNGLFVTSTLGVILITVCVFSSVIRLFTARLEPEIEALNENGTLDLDLGSTKTFFFDENFETIPRTRGVNICGTRVFQALPRRGRTKSLNQAPDTPVQNKVGARKYLTPPHTRPGSILLLHEYPSEQNKAMKDDMKEKGNTTSSENIKDSSNSSRRNSVSVRFLWNKFDNRFLKPIFGGAPHSMDEMESNQLLGSNYTQQWPLHFDLDQHNDCEPTNQELLSPTQRNTSPIQQQQYHRSYSYGATH